MSIELKKIFFQEYGGFADKRIKDLSKSSRFIIDNRGPHDYGSGKILYGYFCEIFADIRSNEQIEISLKGNVPTSKELKKWWSIKSEKSLNIERCVLVINKGEEEKLLELANLYLKIVKDGSRYTVPSYKYVCPRTVESLNRIYRLLHKFWNK